MNHTEAKILRELRDERDSWLQARRELGVMLQAAKDAGQIKVEAALQQAYRHADMMETANTQMLEQIEDLINSRATQSSTQ